MEYPMEFADFEIMVMLAELTDEEREALAKAEPLEDQG